MGPVAAFFGAVFFGAAAGATIGYQIAVLVARLAILSLVSKLLAPKIDLSQVAQDKMLTIKSSIQPQAYVYGQDMISGPIIFGQVTGTKNEQLHRVIAMTGREIDSFIDFRFDDTDILIGVDIPDASDTIIAGQFADVVDIDTKTGTSTQTVIAALNAAIPSLWTAAHTGRGWSMMYTQMRIVAKNTAFESGIPQNLRALVKGNKIYDPRLDSTQTTIPGAGAHRVNDPTTWEWSNNPALCLSDWLMWYQVGMSEESDRIDWDLVAIAADICEEQPLIPPAAPVTTQNRYTCNLTFYANQDRGSIKQILEDSMLGRVVFSQGKWRMWAGAAQTATIELTESNLSGGVFIDASVGFKDRYNRVRGKFVDPSRNYIASAYPEQQNASYVTQDGGQVKYQTFDQNACNDPFQCQRNAIITLRQSRQQLVCKFEGNWSVFQVQSGTVVNVTNAELGWSSKKFFVTEWALNQDGTGVDLTLVEENDSVWTDPLVTDYTIRTPTGELIPPARPPVAISDANIHNTLGSHPVIAGVKAEAGGLIKYSNAAGVYSSSLVPDGEWLGSGLDVYSIRATLNTGGLTNGTLATWEELSVDRTWDIQTTSADLAANITLEITNDPLGAAAILTSGIIDLTAFVTDPIGLRNAGSFITGAIGGSAAQVVPDPGVVVGDNLLVVVAMRGNVPTTIPDETANWTVLKSVNIAGFVPAYKIYRRIATDDANDIFTIEALSQSYVAQMISLRVPPSTTLSFGASNIAIIETDADLQIDYNAVASGAGTEILQLLCCYKVRANATAALTPTIASIPSEYVEYGKIAYYDDSTTNETLLCWAWGGQYQATESAIVLGQVDITPAESGAKHGQVHKLE